MCDPCARSGRCGRSMCDPCARSGRCGQSLLSYPHPRCPSCLRHSHFLLITLPFLFYGQLGARLCTLSSTLRGKGIRLLPTDLAIIMVDDVRPTGGRAAGADSDDDDVEDGDDDCTGGGDSGRRRGRGWGCDDRDGGDGGGENSGDAMEVTTSRAPRARRRRVATWAEQFLQVVHTRNLRKRVPSPPIPRSVHTVLTLRAPVA